MNDARVRRLIENSIRTFELDLAGLVVFTEAATGYYKMTPITAALAGAKKVLAITRDSRYGRAVDVCDEMQTLLRRWGMENQIDFLFSREDERIAEADIITNLGFVRPINARLLSQLKPTAVVPLMWETWEFRQEDLDLDECRRLGISVLGTNEHHTDLRIFEYLGFIALKLLFSLEIEVLRSRIVLLGSGEFAEQTQATLQATKANVVLLNTRNEGALTSVDAHRVIAEADAMVIAEHHSRRPLIGPNGELSAEKLYGLNPRMAIAHICGGVDHSSLKAVGLQCAPDWFAPPGYMSVVVAQLGPKPHINLHTAGLKIGERLARARIRGLSSLDAELAVLEETTLAQGFVGYHVHTQTERESS